MKKYEYHRIEELETQLKKAKVKPAIITRIMRGGDKILKKSKPVEKAEWLRLAMERMDAVLPASVRYQVREECACSTTGGRLKLITKLSAENPELDQFFIAVDRSHIFGKSVKKQGKTVYVDFGLTQCVCSPKFATELVSITYCHCCKGHIIKLLEAALQQPLRGDVISSACSGGKTCRFAIYLS
ncbi:MAG: DUF6144 family protein [bacterium]